MREIKFRAWDDVKKTMMTDQYNDNFDITCYSDNLSVAVVEDDTESYRKIILMEYTGLKDKNGKDIYEGDIVKSYEVGQGECLDYSAPVEYINGEFYPLAGGVDGGHYYESDYEIIGNIYENPELLKEDK